jgi:hypothetical protein
MGESSRSGGSGGAGGSGGSGQYGAYSMGQYDASGYATSSSSYYPSYYSSY